MATTINATDIRRQFAQIAKKVEAGETHIVTRHNKVMFAIISGDDYNRFERLNAIAEHLEMAQQKAMATPAKNVVVTLPPTMYKVEAVAEPKAEAPLAKCLACGEKVAEGTHGTCPKNEMAIPNRVTAEAKGLIPTAAEIEPIMAANEKDLNTTLVAEKKGLFTGDN